MKIEYCLINPAPAFPVLAIHLHISPDLHALSVFSIFLLPMFYYNSFWTGFFLLRGNITGHEHSGVVVLLSASIICTQANTVL